MVSTVAESMNASSQRLNRVLEYVV